MIRTPIQVIPPGEIVRATAINVRRSRAIDRGPRAIDRTSCANDRGCRANDLPRRAIDRPRRAIDLPPRANDLPRRANDDRTALSACPSRAIDRDQVSQLRDRGAGAGDGSASITADAAVLAENRPFKSYPIQRTASPRDSGLTHGGASPRNLRSKGDRLRSVPLPGVLLAGDASAADPVCAVAPSHELVATAPAHAGAVGRRYFFRGLRAPKG